MSNNAEIALKVRSIVTDLNATLNDAAESELVVELDVMETRASHGRTVGPVIVNVVQIYRRYSL